SATRSFDEATRIDPSFAEAHVQALAWSSLAGDAPRAHYDAAMRGRASLDEHGAALLDAFEPAFRATPDPAEIGRRLARIVERDPGDAIAQVILARVRLAEDDPRGAIEVCDRALARDRALAAAWLIEGAALLRLDRGDDAIR